MGRDRFHHNSVSVTEAGAKGFLNIARASPVPRPYARVLPIASSTDCGSVGYAMTSAS